VELVLLLPEAEHTHTHTLDNTHTCYTDALLGFLIDFPPIVKEERCMNPEILCKLVLVIPIVSLFSIHSVIDAEVVTPHLQRL